MNGEEKRKNHVPSTDSAKEIEIKLESDIDRASLAAAAASLLLLYSNADGD